MDIHIGAAAQQSGLSVDAIGVDGMLAVLRRHRDMIDVHQARLAQCAELVEAKIAKYEDLAVTGQPPGPPEVDLE